MGRVGRGGGGERALRLRVDGGAPEPGLGARTTSFTWRAGLFGVSFSGPLVRVFGEPALQHVSSTGSAVEAIALHVVPAGPGAQPSQGGSCFEKAPETSGAHLVLGGRQQQRPLAEQDRAVDLLRCGAAPCAAAAAIAAPSAARATKEGCMESTALTRRRCSALVGAQRVTSRAGVPHPLSRRRVVVPAPACGAPLRGRRLHTDALSHGGGGCFKVALSSGVVPGAVCGTATSSGIPSCVGRNCGNHAATAGVAER